MNKSLIMFIVSALLMLEGISFAAAKPAAEPNNKSSVKKQPSAQEQALWDKIIAAQKEIDTFAGQNAPRPPRADANQSEINNYKKSIETYKNGLLRQVYPLFEMSKEYHTKYPQGLYADNNFALLEVLLAAIAGLNDGNLSREYENFYNMLCQDKNLTADRAIGLISVNLARLQSIMGVPKDNNEPDKIALDSQFDKIEKQLDEFGQKFKSDVFPLQSLIDLSNNLEPLYTQRSIKIIEIAQKYVSNDDKKILDSILRGKRVVGTKPEIKFKSIDGRDVDLSKLTGKVVLIDFWATWCPGCMQEMPNVIKLYNKYHDKGFEIIGINFDADIDTAKKFISANKLAWPQYVDGKYWSNEIGQYYGILQLPSTWIVDKSGKVVEKNIYGKELADKVAKLLSAEK